MDVPGIFASLIIALGLGLLVGLQRERTKSRLGGIRTFGLITLSGALCALLSQPPLGLGGWVVGAGMLGLVAVIVTENRVWASKVEARAGGNGGGDGGGGGAGVGGVGSGGEGGITSEVAMLAMFAVGAYVVVGPREVAVAIGAAIAILLQAKPVLHGIVAKLGDIDVRAIMQFALISLIILPVVPDRTFGPYAVLNLHNIWLMVVLVVGISLGGFIAYKFVGGGAGILLSGVLGGLISSTATSVSYARRTASAPEYTGAATAVILIASTLVYARLLVEISLTAPGFLSTAAGPLGVLGGASAVLSLVCWLGVRRSGDGLPAQTNPTELKSALVFAGVYALVLVAVAAAKQHFGQGGLYTVSAISGLTDMDAITLSVSRMVNAGSKTGIDSAAASTAWRAIVIAAMSNAAFKATMVGVLGCPALARRVAFFFGIKLLAAGALLMFWP